MSVMDRDPADPFKCTVDVDSLADPERIARLWTEQYYLSTPDHGDHERIHVVGGIADLRQVEITGGEVMVTPLAEVRAEQSGARLILCAFRKADGTGWTVVAEPADRFPELVRVLFGLLDPSQGYFVS